MNTQEKQEIKKGNEVVCAYCKNKFIRNRKDYHHVHYCSDKCALEGRKLRDRKNWELIGLRSKDYFTNRTREYTNKFPEKSKSQHYAKRHNMRDIKCLFCGNENNLEIHHLRYRTPVMPEDVITLCKHCHGKITIITRIISSLTAEKKDAEIDYILKEMKQIPINSREKQIIDILEELIKKNLLNQENTAASCQEVADKKIKEKKS